MVDVRAENRVRTGQFEIDFVECEISKSGRKVPLQEQPFRVLAILLEHPGELVTRRDLQSRLWPGDTYVGFEEGLNTAIRKLRLAFGDSADNPRFIETVPKRGYRFIAPVSGVDSPRTEASLVPLKQEAVKKPYILSKWQLALLVLAILAAALVVIPGTQRWITSGITSRLVPMAHIESLAVLPLENLSNDPNQDYFVEGMTDQLITDLGQIKSLRVISRTSVMQYEHTHKPIPEIARELNVDAIVEGTVLKAGNQVRITTQLIQARLDRHLWAQSYEGDLRDVLTLQSSVSDAITHQIQASLSSGEKTSRRPGRAINPEAYENYLKGLHYWNKRDDGGLNQATKYFQQAIAIDPNYAPAYAGLAQTYALVAGNVGPKEYFTTEGEKTARKAITLDPNLAEAHTALALLLGYDYKFVEEEQEFKLAVNLDPNYATGHHWFGEAYLAQIGRFEEANYQMQQALALDPASKIIATDWGATLYLQRRYGEAYRQLSKAIAMDSNFSEAYLWRSKVLLQQHKYADGIADIQTAERITSNSQTIPPYLAYAYGVSGNRREARARLQNLLVLSQKEYVSPWAIGLVYLGLGDHANTLTWFEKAIREHSPHMVAGLAVSPECDPLREDPRFKDLLAHLNLPR
jgi:TolB-like protein/DNA-binding winged helix-turn-helix (wHTH) protein/Tfp pilus assembly protein PilF